MQTLQIYLSQAIFREAGYFYRAIIIISEKQLSHCINLSVKQIEMQIEVDKFGQWRREREEWGEEKRRKKIVWMSFSSLEGLVQEWKSAGMSQARGELYHCTSTLHSLPQAIFGPSYN